MTNPNFQQLTVVAGVALHRGRALLMRRNANLSHGGMWEFPGGKVEPGESLEDALRRELREELNHEIKILSPMAIGHVVEENRWLRVVAFNIEFKEEPTGSTDHDLMQWLSLEDLPHYKLAAADYEIALTALSNHFEVNRLNIMSCVRFASILFFIFGVLSALIVAIMNQFSPEAELLPPMVGTFALLLIPILDAVIGAVLAFVGASFYNLFSDWIGGIEVSVVKK